MRLGDLGADVIKIETKGGDPARSFMRIIGAMTGLNGRNYYFEHCNRNKRGMLLNIRTEEGMEVFLRIIDEADVFLNNLSIEAPVKMGIGPDELLVRNPRLIYAQASGWGRKGPNANDYCFDYTAIARSGLMMSCGERGAPPTQTLPGVGDELAALMCAWGVTAALFEREKTGLGQVVDTSSMGSVIATLGLVMAAPAILGAEFPREVRTEAGNPMYNHYRCHDDKWIAIAHLQPERYWPKICRALDLEELEDDPRFVSFEARSANAKELIAIFDKQFATRPRDQWLDVLQKEGCICTPVQTPSEVVNDPQALANNYFVDTSHSVHGNTRVVGFPWDFSRTPASYRREAPGLGQHTHEILSELGYSKARIGEMEAQGVIS